MRKLLVLAAAVSALALLLAGAAMAQRGRGGPGRGGGGWGLGSQFNRVYNPKTVETVSGEVLSVDKVTSGRGMSYGIHLKLKTAKETIPVHLGPGWYVEEQSVEIEPKDKVSVMGSRVTFEGKPAIIAGEVKKGDSVLTLRDENGFPLWAGRGRRQQ